MIIFALCICRQRRINITVILVVSAELEGVKTTSIVIVVVCSPRCPIALWTMSGVCHNSLHHCPLSLLLPILG